MHYIQQSDIDEWPTLRYQVYRLARFCNGVVTPLAVFLLASRIGEVVGCRKSSSAAW